MWRKFFLLANIQPGNFCVFNHHCGYIKVNIRLCDCKKKPNAGVIYKMWRKFIGKFIALLNYVLCIRLLLGPVVIM